MRIRRGPGGQRQRVLVARALSVEPSVLLLDEPCTGLDVPTQELLTDLFGELSDEGKAVLMTTHDLVGAVHTCDKLCLVNRTVIATGTPDTLRDGESWRCSPQPCAVSSAAMWCCVVWRSSATRWPTPSSPASPPPS
ncbi:AAA family ATPase [Streptomyces sp. NPDC058374]|uniref:AAA family ATPase n=1 Tax=Streptomyces sp. NPDC058374 TaxID=3346466 RepID=UPI0036614871